MSSTTRASDAATQQTDVDALTSRASAASLGYFPDPYASHFLSPSARRSLEKRPALINIGTHARTWAVDQLVEQFLTASAFKGKGRQVLSLGAGTDTRYWRMRDKLQEWDCEWVEVDFEEATAGKVRKVMGHARMKELLGGDVKLSEWCTPYACIDC
jgi:[phosphatase 2A protein]-leucine-carboxy methyltransferase